MRDKDDTEAISLESAYLKAEKMFGRPNVQLSIDSATCWVFVCPPMNYGEPTILIDKHSGVAFRLPTGFTCALFVEDFEQKAGLFTWLPDGGMPILNRINLARRRLLQCREVFEANQTAPAASSLVRALEQLAREYIVERRLEEADHFYWEAVELSGQFQGLSSAEHIKTASGYAELLMNLGRTSQSEALYEQCLGASTNLAGATIIDLLLPLSIIKGEKGSYAESESLARRAVEIQEGVFGKNHRLTVNSLCLLALCCQRQCNYIEAEDLYRRALKIYEDTNGTKSIQVTSCLESYSDLLREMNRIAEADELTFRARANRVWLTENNLL